MSDRLLDHRGSRLIHSALRASTFAITAFALVFLLGAPPEVEAAVFPDVPASHTNATAIDYLTTEGVIGGYPDGLFRPDQPINRAEALKIILLGSGIATSSPRSAVFPDVPAESWFAPFIETAKMRAIVGGYPDGFFRPEQTVNLVEALKMALTANQIELTNYATKVALFSDTDAGAWYNAFLGYAQKFELVSVDDGNRVYPATPLTRGQLAEVMYRYATRITRVCPRLLENIKTKPADYFSGLTLEQSLPIVFYEDEVYALRGSTGVGVEAITAFFSKADGEQVVFSATVESGQFTLPVEFRAPGFYNFAVLPGTSGRSVVATVEVLPRECAPATVAVVSSTPTGLTASIIGNEPVLRWDNGTNNLTRVVLRQGEQRYERLLSAGQAELTLDPADFTDWAEGSATVQVFGAYAENGVSYAPRTEWAASSTLTLTLDQHHFSEWREQDLFLDSLPVTHDNTLTLTGTTRITLEPMAYAITPRGTVTEVAFTGDPVVVPAGSRFTLDFAFPESGTYIIEINDTDGLAVLNHPLYQPDTFPLLPDFQDLREYTDSPPSLSLNRERSIWLRLINEARAKAGLGAVSLSTGLTSIAQDHADQMAINNFFSHVDLAGRDPEARRRLAGWELPVGENLAQDMTTKYAHAGLLRSAAHRANILDPEWGQVGLGIAENSNGDRLFVQEFSVVLRAASSLTDLAADLVRTLSVARQSRGLAAFSTHANLVSAANAWSEQMADENFLATEHGADSLEATIRATGFTGSLNALVFQSSRLASVEESLLADERFLTVESGTLAIGLAQGSDGMYRATVIYR